MADTRAQAFRCSRDLWEAAADRFRAAGTNTSSALRGFLTVAKDATDEQIAEILKAFPPQDSK